MKIIHQKSKCIGCGTCVAVCPQFFVMGQDGKAELKGAKIDAQGQEILQSEKIGCVNSAVESCPAKVIKVL